MPRLPAAALLLAGCLDYNLVRTIDPPGIGTDPTDPPSTPTTTGTCAVDLVPGKEIAVDPVCAASGGGWGGKIVHIDVDLRNEAIGDANSTPAIGDLTGDDAPEIAVTTTAGTLVVLTNDLETVVWSAPALGPEPASPAIGDLDGDGRADVVVAGVDGIAAYAGVDGHALWSLPAIPGAAKAASCGGVGIYDLDLDGLAEVVIGRTILAGADGSVRGIGAYGEGTAHATGALFGAAADLDGDGDLEVVTGNAAYEPDGTAVWANGEADGFVGVADFDGDIGGEVVVTSFTAGTDAEVRLQDADGAVLWRHDLDHATAGPPLVADLDGDGALEIGVATDDTLFVLDADGDERWTADVDDRSSGYLGAAAFDFEGDGILEIVYGDEKHIWLFDGETGDVKEKDSEHSSSTCTQYPAIADIDGDGHAEVVHTSSGDQSGVRVLRDRDTPWMPARPIWNQHTYAVTNVEEDGTLPASPSPNWPTYNRWRAAGTTSGAGVADAVPLLGGVCPCEGLVVQVGNDGGATLPAGIAVSLYDGATWLATAYTDAPLAPGEVSAGIAFPAAAATARVVVDDPGAVAECLEGNNALLVDVCP